MPTMPTGDWPPTVHPAGCRCQGCAQPITYQPMSFADVRFPFPPVSLIDSTTTAPRGRFVSRIRVPRRRTR